jgi:cytochrome c oxidase subunit 2
MSPQIEEVIFFHDHAIVVAVMVSVLTFYCITSFVLSSVFDVGKVEASLLERGWTIAPIVTLLLLGLPSLSLLYKMEEDSVLSNTLKVTGHQ